MALQSVANTPLGTAVWVWENGKKAEYIVVKHDYAAAENGAGYDLLMRKTPLSTTRVWDSSYSSPSTTWADCALRSWLRNTFPDYFDPEYPVPAVPIKVPIQETTDTFFVLDTDEMSGSSSDLLDLDIRRILMAVNGNRSVWGRDSKADTYTSGDGTSTECRYGYYWYVNSNGLHVSSTECYRNCYVQPCFAVKGNLAAVSEDGMLIPAPPPDVVSDYFGSEATMVKRGPFQVPYRVKDANRSETNVVVRLDGAYIGFEKAKYMELHWASVDEALFAALDEESDHVLMLQVTNGASVTRKSFRFRKATNLGYILYMGRITGTEDGKSYYWSEREVLHDSHDPDGPLVLDPEVQLEKNNFGSLSFTLPAGNPMREKIGLKKTVVSVEADGAEIWCGYVTELTPGFDLGIEVYCEGELGYLQDRDCDLEEKAYTVEELVKVALTAKEDFGKEGKTFLPGTITVAKPESKKEEKEAKSIQSCWDLLESNLISNYGGYLRLRKEIKMENGKRIYTRYLDYMKTIPDRTGQTIEFGVNMLDLSYYMKVNSIVNSVIARGYATRGWWIFSSTSYLEVEERNQESIDAYGLVQRIVTVDGTSSDEASLRKVAKEQLADFRASVSSGLEIDAADLADTGVNCDRLEFLKNTRIVSKPHGLDDWVLCTKMTIPIDAPEDKSFTFGDSTEALSSIQATNYGTAGKAWSAIQATMQYIKG